MDNKYLAKAVIEYKSGKYVSKILVPEGVKVGDRIKCRVVSGYEAFATIKSIEDYAGSRKGKYAKAIELSSKSKEDNDMIVKSELFDMVLVVSNRGFATACKAAVGMITTEDIGRKCVYESDDDHMHVGDIADIVPKGESRNISGVQDGKYFVQFVNTDLRDFAFTFNQAYHETVNKLKARKKLLEERAIWEMLAKQDPEAANLLDTLDRMTGGNFNGSI